MTGGQQIPLPISTIVPDNIQPQALQLCASLADGSESSPNAFVSGTTRCKVSGTTWGKAITDEMRWVSNGSGTVGQALRYF